MSITPNITAANTLRNCPILDIFHRYGEEMCSKSKLQDCDLDTLGIAHDRHTIIPDFQEMSDLWLE